MIFFCSRMLYEEITMDKMIPQHKRMAMGQERVGFKKGGAVPNPKVMKGGVPNTPLTNVKRANGIKGMKHGGPC